jgi:hypothetical protein
MASRLLEDKILGGGQNFDDDDNGPRGGDSRRSSRASSEEEDGDVPTGTATGARAGRSHALAAMLADAALDPLGRRDDTGGRGGRGKGSSSSGPRAVMADKAWADELEARQAERESLTKWSMARRAAVGVASDGPSVSAAAEGARRREERAGRERANDDDDDDDRGGGDASREDDDDDDDDEVASLAALREARLRELRALSSSSTSSASSAAAAAASALAAAALEAAPAFGSVADIYAQDDLPSLVDDTPRATVVLCLLWEDYVPASDPWRRAWPLLAARFPHTRFLAMQARVASTHWDPIALPALAVYRGGQTVDTAVRLQGPEGEGGAGLGSAPTAEAIAQWLVRRGWCRGAAAARTQGRRDERSDGSESEEEEGERRGGWGRR